MNLTSRINTNAFNFLKNLSYTFLSNIVSMLVSVFTILIIPKFICIDEYAYWQLYIFYSSLAGYLHLGWPDGINLRYGGYDYDDLDKRLFLSQLLMFSIQQVILMCFILLVSKFVNIKTQKSLILTYTAISMVIINIRNMPLYLFQATNKIIDYAKILMLDRIIFIIITTFFIVFGIQNFDNIIYADLIGKFISLLYAFYLFRDILFPVGKKYLWSFQEAFKNIEAGMKLLIANVTGMMIISTVRIGIERTWDVVTFGKVSLTLSISNFLIIFVNAMGLIMFPVLKRTKVSNLSSIYRALRIVFISLLLILLITYFPLRYLLNIWLPKYEESLKYMAILFPICLYEGKLLFLINTYLKALRKENLLLYFNVLTLLLSLVVTSLTTIVFKNLNMAVISIIFLLAFRSIIAEYILSSIMKIKIKKEIFSELLMTVIFIITAWMNFRIISPVLYTIAILVYIFFFRQELKDSIGFLKKKIITEKINEA